MSGVLIIIAELICLVLMVVNAYLAFKAKQKDDLNMTRQELAVVLERLNLLS